MRERERESFHVSYREFSNQGQIQSYYDYARKSSFETNYENDLLDVA